MKRSTNCLSKLDRMRKTLLHQEADRVPVSDFFWGSFLRRWRDELGLPADTEIYRYYDLDWMNGNPNLDPHIKPFETLRENEQEAPAASGGRPGPCQRFLRGRFSPRVAGRTRRRKLP